MIIKKNFIKTQRNASDYAISRSMTRLWEIFQYQPNTDEIRQAFDNHRIAEVKYFSVFYNETYTTLN